MAADVRGRAVRRRARCSTGSPTRSGSASPSSTPTAGSSASRRSPTQPKSDLIPIGVYFLRPDAFDVIDHLAAVGPRRARDHRRPQPLHPATAGLFSPVYDGHWTDAGTVPSLLRAAELAAADDAAGRLAAAGQPAGGLTVAETPALRPPARHRRCRVHRLVLRPRRPRPPRRHADHGPRQADLRRQRGEPRPGPRRPGDGRPVRVRPRRHRRPGRRRAARRRRRRGRQLRRRVARRPLDPRPGGVPGDRRHRRPRPARGVPGRRRPAALPAGLDRRGLRLGRRGPRRARTRRSRRARRTPRPRRPASCSSGATSSPTASTPSSPAARTRTGRTTIPRSSSRCSSPTRSTTARCRSTATACSGASGCTSPITPPAIDFVLRHGDDRRDLQRRRADRADEPRRRRAPARPARQAVVAGQAGRGPARARPALRDGRHEAGGPRLAAARRRSRTAWRRRSTGTGPTRRGGARPARATGTAGTSASTASGWRPGSGRATSRPPRTRRPRLMRVAVTGAGGRLGSALVTALADAPFTGPAGPIAWDRDGVRPRRARRDRRRGSTATGPRSSSTPRPGPTSTAAPSTRSWRSGATAIATGVLAEACADARDRPADRLDQRGLRRGLADGRPWRADRSDRARATRTAPRRLAGERLADRGVRRAARRRARDRPDGVAVRGARARLPEPHPRCRRACRGPPASRSAPSATSGGPRPTPPTSPTRSSSCSRTTPIAGIHHLVNGLFATRADWARYVVGRAGIDVEVVNVPDVDLGAPVAAAALGRPGGRRRCRPASRSASGPTRWPTTRRASCARRGPSA